MTALVCRADESQSVCAERRAAIVAGTFFYDWQRRAWVLGDVPQRRVSWQARYFGEPRGVADHDGEPFHIADCPWCGGELPDLATLRDSETKALGQGDGDGPEG